jgi:hypothetical protein
MQSSHPPRPPAASLQMIRSKDLLVRLEACMKPSRVGERLHGRKHPERVERLDWSRKVKSSRFGGREQGATDASRLPICSSAKQFGQMAYGQGIRTLGIMEMRPSPDQLESPSSEIHHVQRIQNNIRSWQPLICHSAFNSTPASSGEPMVSRRMPDYSLSEQSEHFQLQGFISWVHMNMAYIPTP